MQDALPGELFQAKEISEALRDIMADEPMTDHEELQFGALINEINTNCNALSAKELFWLTKDYVLGVMDNKRHA